MTVWSPTDVRSIAVPGGCGNSHSAPDDLQPGESMSVDCPPCEPLILAITGWGWATDPKHVDLTCDERLAAEAAEREGSVATNVAMRALGREVADRMHGPAPVAYAPQPTLMEQILAMTPAEKALVASMLAPPAPPAEVTEVTEVTEPVEVTEPAPPADTPAPAPAVEAPAPAPAKKATPAKKTAPAADKG